MKVKRIVVAILFSNLLVITCTELNSTDYVSNDENDAATNTLSEEYTCTQVIGFSQTREWFLDVPDFESIVDSDKWQLLWRKGASVDAWADPSFSGWNKSIESPCAQNSTSPDRVLLTISGSEESNPSKWANSIKGAINVIRDKYPSLRQIILQPVIGGPNDGTCFFDNTKVRASVNHPVIDEAIGMVVGDDVVAGMSPEVIDCSDYRDSKGHISNGPSDHEGGRPISTLIGQFYANFANDDPTSDTTPPFAPRNVRVAPLD